MGDKEDPDDLGRLLVSVSTGIREAFEAIQRIEPSNEKAEALACIRFAAIAMMKVSRIVSIDWVDDE